MTKWSSTRHYNVKVCTPPVDLSWLETKINPIIHLHSKKPWIPLQIWTVHSLVCINHVLYPQCLHITWIYQYHNRGSSRLSPLHVCSIQYHQYCMRDAWSASAIDLSWLVFKFKAHSKPSKEKTCGNFPASSFISLQSQIQGKLIQDKIGVFLDLLAVNRGVKQEIEPDREKRRRSNLWVFSLL